MDEPHREISLLGRVADGDREAFQALFEQYWPKVYRKSLHLLKSPDLAQDLAQEVFIKVWEKRGQFRTIGNFDAYLFVLVKNLFVDYLRKKLITEVPIAEMQEDSLPVDGDDAQTSMENRELEHLMHRAIENLPAQLQTAFRLSRFEGLTHRQIALEMKITKITSQNYLARALLHIRGFLNSRQEENIS